MTERRKDSLAVVERLVRRLVPPPPLANGALRVLMVDDLVPDPLLGAGYPRAFEIVRSLITAGHRVSFYPMQADAADIARMTAAFDGTVRFIPSDGVAGLRRLLTARGDGFDVVFASRPTPMRSVVETGWASSRTRIIYDAEAVLAPREERRRALYGPLWSPEEYQTALQAELELARRADAVTAVSRQDAALIRATLDVPVFVLSHRVDSRPQSTAFEDQRDLLFVGRLTGTAASNANVDSLVWFVTEVMPELDAMIGTDWLFHVAGLVDAPELAVLASPRVVLHGVVEDLAPFYARCRVFVAPTRFAAGIPLKLVEAMGQGIPCVATPLPAEQLGVDAAALPTGATPRAFAERCQMLYQNVDGWQAVRDAAMAHVAQHYSQPVFDHALADALEQCRPVAKKGNRK